MLILYLFWQFHLVCLLVLFLVRFPPVSRSAKGGGGDNQKRCEPAHISRHSSLRVVGDAVLMIAKKEARGKVVLGTEVLRASGVERL